MQTTPRLHSLCAALALLAFVLPATLRAQGGPPMITDDPGTPGPGKWEINLAGTIERVPGSRTWEAPAWDLNYGWGDRLQLKLESAFVIRERSEHGPIGGFGNAIAGVKWRFLDEENAGVAISTYPQLEWNITSASSRRGLADAGTHLLLPLEIARKIGWLEVNGDAGTVLDFRGSNECIYGLLFGVPIKDQLELLAELHGTMRTRDQEHELTINLGARQKLTEHLTLLVALGHDVHAMRDESRRFIGYLGVQFHF